MELILLRKSEFLFSLGETILFCITGLNFKFDLKFKVKLTVKFQKIIRGRGNKKREKWIVLHYISNLLDYNIICRNINIFKAMELSSAAIEANGDFVLIIPTVRFIF